MKPKSPGSLSFIKVPQASIPIVDHNNIEDTLLEYSRTHFAKAKGSTFTTEPLTRLLHYDGLTMFGEWIFKGNLPDIVPPLDEPTKAILNNLKGKLPPTTTLANALDYSWLIEGIKKWPEQTTTSTPSGWHLGIYKTLAKHIWEQKKSMEEQVQEDPTGCLWQGWDILYLIFDIMSVALKHSYPLKQWHTVWTLFIKKELGNPDINKLCCIKPTGSYYWNGTPHTDSCQKWRVMEL